MNWRARELSSNVRPGIGVELGGPTGCGICGISPAYWVEDRFPEESRYSGVLILTKVAFCRESMPFHVKNERFPSVFLILGRLASFLTPQLLGVVLLAAGTLKAMPDGYAQEVSFFLGSHLLAAFAHGPINKGSP